MVARERPDPLAESGTVRLEPLLSGLWRVAFPKTFRNPGSGLSGRCRRPIRGPGRVGCRKTGPAGRPPFSPGDRRSPDWRPSRLIRSRRAATSVGPEAGAMPSRHALCSRPSPRRPRRPRRRQRPRERRVHQRCSDSEFADLKRAADVGRMPIGGYVAESSPATTGPRAAAAGAVRGIDCRIGRRRRPSNHGAVSR